MMMSLDILSREIPLIPENALKAPVDRATARKRKAMKIERTQNCMEAVYEMLHSVSELPGKDECSVCTDLLTEVLGTLDESTFQVTLCTKFTT
jgi:hypothetical protein